MSKPAFNPDNHTYTSDNGNICISVTQLLKKHELSPSFDEVPVAVLSRAAERGTAIHAEFEEIVNTDGEAVVLSNEAQWFREEVFPYGKWESEQIVWTEGDILAFAGTIDLILHRDNGSIALFDIKTGKVHPDAVAWQLSLYRYAYAQRNNLDLDKIELYCIDAKPEACKVIPVTPVKTEEIKRLMRFETEGIPYTPGDIILSQASLARVEEFENALAELKRQEKVIQDQYDTFQNQLMNAMLENGVKTFETPKFKVTFVASTVATGFDSARFKTDHADLYSEYCTKVTAKKAYLKVTEKKA